MLLGGVVQATHCAEKLNGAARVVFLPTAITGTMPSFAVFRHHGDAVGCGLLAVKALHWLAINKFSLPRRGQTPNRHCTASTSGADQPGDAEDSATQGNDVIDPFNGGLPGARRLKVINPRISPWARLAGIMSAEARRPSW